MKLHRTIAYGLMAAGALISARNVRKRRRWEQANVNTAIMLDWDDVRAVAARAVTGLADDPQAALYELLTRYKAGGATHLSIPELTLNRLLKGGQISVVAGSSPRRVYLQGQDAGLVDLAATELAARLPRIKVIRSGSQKPVFSFIGDLPAVAEVGLGFDPRHADLARQAGLAPVVRPVGYSWVQPAMIDRTLDQAAALGANIVAVQGELIPGHEFKIQHTVEAMRRNRLAFAYFRQSRHQRGDWFLAKALARHGQVILAHEFEPPELLAEDWHTISRRWANLAVEDGVRLCSVRFFKVLHAADPLESVAYVQSLARALLEAGLVVNQAGGVVDLTGFQPARDDLALAGVGASAAGALGLAADLLPLPGPVKLGGMAAGVITLAGLPFVERTMAARSNAQSHSHDHSHDHDHDHHHHDHDHHDHDHDHGHHHDESHGPETAYASKGLALAASALYPAAAAAINGGGAPAALAHSLAVSAAGVITLSAVTAEGEYLLGIEEYRPIPLDWLLPLGLAAGTALFDDRASGLDRAGWRRWLPLAGVLAAALKSFSRPTGRDFPAGFDREHRHAHTHHLSAFQRIVGDTKMILSPRPLRKWSLLAPLGAVAGALLRRRGREVTGAAALTMAAAGQAAILTGFRNGQRPLDRTVTGRAGSWTAGALLAGLAWAAALLAGNGRFFNRDR